MTVAAPSKNRKAKKMASTRNVLVTLRRPDTTLRCPETGWSIRRKEQKRTPTSSSSRIADWIRNGALIVLETADAPSQRYHDLLDEPTAGKTKEQLIDLAERINQAVGEQVIDTKDVNKQPLLDAISEWKEQQVAAADSKEKADA